MNSKNKIGVVGLTKKDRFLAVVQEAGEWVKVTVFGDGRKHGREVFETLAKELADNLVTFLRLIPREKRRCVICGRDVLKVSKFNFAFGFTGHFEELAGFLCKDHMK